MPTRLQRLAGLALALLLPWSAAQAQRIKLPVKLPELEARVKADSNDPAAHYNVALGYWNEKRWDDAEHAIRTAILLEPRFAPAHLALAYLPYARQPKLWNQVWEHKVPEEDAAALKESDQEYRRAFLIDPLVDIRIIGAVTPGKVDFLAVQDYLGEAYALFFQGFTDCQEGDYETCHQRFTALIREIKGDRYPDRVPNSVLWYKGLAAAHIQKYDIAAQHFKLLIDRNINFEKELESKGELSRVPLETNEFRFALATIQQSAGLTGEAVALYQQVLEADAGVYMAHVRLANIYEAARDYPHAIQERNYAININPDDPSLVLDLGITLGKAGMMPDAEARLKDAIAANPRDSRSYFWLGLAEMEQGKQQPAREAFTTFLALSPTRYDRQIAMARERLSKLQ